MKLTHQCANCLHRWYTLRKWCCGKEAVSQRGVDEARAEDGDCGPDAKFYLEDEEQRYAL